MNTWGKISVVFIVIALAAWPVANLHAYSNTSESDYDSCVASSWSGLLPGLSADTLNTANQTKSSEEVFCGHFMSVEDLPTDSSTADVVSAPTVFTLPSFRLYEPVFIRQKTPVTSDHIPYSPNPEVAPHPPKYC